MSDVPLIVRADLPTPDVVVVRHESGAVTVVADASLAEADIHERVGDLDQLVEGTGYDIDEVQQ